MHRNFFKTASVVAAIYILPSRGYFSQAKMSFGQFAASTQFYIYGKNHCTRNGWDAATAKYPKPNILEDESLDLSGKTYIITGANAGIGKEITSFLASKGANIYMVCRSLSKGEEAKAEIIEKTKADGSKVRVMLCDCSLESDVRKMWVEFEQHQQSSRSPAEDSSSGVKLDGLICNAGALLNEKTFTSEGVEVTFAAHLLFGTYLLGSLAMPTLESTPGSRLIVVSSGGMYNTKFPAWEDATSTGNKAYDGQFAYAYAKRGQVLLCENWTEKHPAVKIVSCHPGWTLTGGVEAAYGEKKSYLEPLRTLWQGAEGIVWLAVADAALLEGGGFYLDRSPQVKHIAGPFMTEGSFTKNTPEETNELIKQLDLWSNSATRPTLEECLRQSALKVPLTATTTPIDIQRFMGKWYVLASQPTSFEIGASNCVENYSWNEKRKAVDIHFDFVPAGAKTGTYSDMRGNIVNDGVNTQWSLSPKLLSIYWPLGITYLVLYTAEDYSYTIVGVPDRKYLWIMTRLKPAVKDGATSDPPPAVVVAAVAAEPSLSSSSASVSESASAAAVVSIGEVPVGGSSTATKGEGVIAAAEGEEQGQHGVSPTATVAAHETLSPEREEEIMREALHKAEQLGYDVTKVKRNIWT